MSIPLKHHFLPEFYLKRWAGRDGRLVEYRRVRPNLPVVRKQVFPSQTGYVRELYAIRSRRNPAARQEMEISFMAPLDSAAAVALDHIERLRTKPVDPVLALNWSRFVLSMLNRHPARVAWFRSKVSASNTTVLENIRAAYEQLRRLNDPPTFDDYVRERGEAHIDENQANVMQDLINSAWLVGHIAKMAWSVLDLDRPKFGMLTGDDPVMTSNGIGGPDGFIILPIGPASIFIAANDPKVINAFAVQPTRLEQGFNDGIARQATQLVLAKDDRQTEFIERRLGLTPAAARTGFDERLTWKAPLVRLGASRKAERGPAAVG